MLNSINLDISAATFKGSRSSNQDSFFAGKGIIPENDIFFSSGSFFTRAKPGSTVFALADGMGGMENGHIASNTAVNFFIKNKKQLKKNAEAFWIKANNAVIKTGERTGTTLVAAEITAADEYSADITFYSVGDSLIYIYDAREKKVFLLNELDNLAYRWKQNGEAQEHTPQELRRASCTLMDFLGADYPGKIPVHCYKKRLFEGDAIILASDGMTLSPEEITTLIFEHSRYPDLATALGSMAVAKASDKCDNTTVITAVLGYIDNREYLENLYGAQEEIIIPQEEEPNFDEVPLFSDEDLFFEDYETNLSEE